MSKDCPHPKEKEADHTESLELSCAVELALFNKVKLQVILRPCVKV